MTRRVKKILLASYISALIVSWVLTVFSENESVVTVSAIIFLSILFIGVSITFAAASIMIKKDKSRMQEFLKEKDYLTAKEVFEQKYKSYLLARQTAKYYILVACFAMDDLDAARKLVAKEWRAMHLYAKYFETLLNLKDDNPELARANSATLLRSKHKSVAPFVAMLTRIFNAIDTQSFTDHFYQDSIYPIVKDIYDKYSLR